MRGERKRMRIVGEGKKKKRVGMKERWKRWK